MIPSAKTKFKTAFFAEFLWLVLSQSLALVLLPFLSTHIYRAIHLSFSLTSLFTDKSAGMPASSAANPNLSLLLSNTMYLVIYSSKATL